MHILLTCNCSDIKLVIPTCWKTQQINRKSHSYFGMPLMLLDIFTFLPRPPRVLSADFRKAPAVCQCLVQCPRYLAHTPQLFGPTRIYPKRRCSSRIYAATSPGSATAKSTGMAPEILIILFITMSTKHRSQTNVSIEAFSLQVDNAEWIQL